MRQIWENEWGGFMNSNNVINLVNKADCSGCGACVCACPKKCLLMKSDSEGFYYPHIDDKSCIDCGKCLSVCAVKSKPKINSYGRRVFIVQHKNDKIRRESTSGGAFTAIAEYIIKNGGIVFGAGMNENFRVCHMPAYNLEQLALFRNSKYSQSDLGDTFLKIKNYLAEGKKILFSGTPCQVAGLKKFLHGDDENLVTVDVVCRGIPSPLVFEKYIDYQKKRLGEFDKVLFRDKYSGYTHTAMSVYRDNVCLYHNGLEYDPMLKLFYQGMICRPVCSNCRFKEIERCSDFTLWDCFSAAEINSDFDDNKGTTFVMLHSQNAETIFEKIRDNIRACEAETEKVCNNTAEMLKSISHNPKRQEFFKDVNSMQPEELFDKWAPVTLTVRLNKLLRNILAKLGLYYIAKNLALKLKK